MRHSKAKGKRGRPPGKVFTRRLVVNMTPEKYEQVREAAKTEGISISQFMRNAILAVTKLLKAGKL